MSMDLTGINNRNEYYTNHYFASIFEENAADTIKKWREAAQGTDQRTPWALLREAGKRYFMIKNLSAADTAHIREQALQDAQTYSEYFNEYTSIAGQQGFMSATQNYPLLKGMKCNLFKCFLPQAWMYGNKDGTSAFVHPEGVYDDPKGGKLRAALYPKLRMHYQFTNEFKLFEGVDHHASFSLNVYRNDHSRTFETIGNLFDPNTIEECYDASINGTVPGIKDENGNWNSHGHPDRVIKVGERELRLFAKLFDGSEEWKAARLPVLHAKQLVEVLNLFGGLNAYSSDMFFGSTMWNETNSTKDGTIKKSSDMPNSSTSVVYTGPLIGVANPLFKSARRICDLNSDFDNVDLTTVGPDYLQRCKYAPAINISDFIEKTPDCNGAKFVNYYRVASREMANLTGERTLIPAIIPPFTTHVITLFSVCLYDINKLPPFSAILASLPYDFYIKATGRGHINQDAISKLPIANIEKNSLRLSCRALLLNCLTSHYSSLLKECFDVSFNNDSWSKHDPRLRQDRFSCLTSDWTWDTPFRTDYERRQALVEIDVLTAIALGMTLDQLKTIYRIQFPVLQQYEADTWYDANGRIVFTTNRSLTGVGFSRPEWENGIKGAPAGKKFYRTITDDTQPGGPVQRTIEYVAPFDKCDREKDYEVAWEYFSKK